jgi:hypothetical protein
MALMNRVTTLLLALLLLAACATEQAAPQEVVTTVPEEQATETATATTAPTLAPRSTLPPTWTPGVAATDTPVSESASAAGQTPPPTIVVPTLPEACNTFEPDLERTPRTYRAGQDVTVYWTPVEGAGFFYIALTDETATVVFEDYTEDTTYTFPAELFESGKLYGWQAHPVDARGIQMCLARGAELFPDF